MRRAMSECSHLSVPSGADPPDHYPGGAGPGQENSAPPAGGGPRRSSHSPAMKRSLTVSEDPAPPQTLSAAGATRADLSQPADPGPAHFLSAPEGGPENRFPPLEGAVPDGVSLPVPLSPGGHGTPPESGSGPAHVKDAPAGVSPVPDSGPPRSGHGDELTEGTATGLDTEPSGPDPGVKVGGDTEGFFESRGDAGPPGTGPSVSALEGRCCSFIGPRRCRSSPGSDPCSIPCSDPCSDPSLGFYQTAGQFPLQWCAWCVGQGPDSVAPGTGHLSL